MNKVLRERRCCSLFCVERPSHAHVLETSTVCPRTRAHAPRFSPDHRVRDDYRAARAGERGIGAPLRAHQPGQLLQVAEP